MKEYCFGVVPFIETEHGFQVLLVQHLAGHWGIPKGHPEGSETPETTARRELKEETGIVEYAIVSLQTITEHYMFSEDDQEVDKTVRYFLGQVQNTTVELGRNEMMAYAWLSFDEAIERVTYNSNRQVLREARAMLEK